VVTTRPDMDDIRPVVLAIVLTFRAPGSLARCLGALGSQTHPPDGVLVIDNAEPPTATLAGLDDVLRTRARLLATGENLGPAGGHGVGLAQFRDDHRFTHAWVMDDDCLPEPDALAALTAGVAGLEPAHVVFPTWVDGRTGIAQDYPGWCGLLIDRPAVVRAGLPRAEFFWWAEDTEYLQHRMPRRGVKVDRNASAVVVHEPVRRATGRAPWKTYYEVRNSIYYRLHVQRRWPVGPLKLARVLAAILVSSLGRQDRREQLSMYVRGLVDGARGRLGKRVDPEAGETSASEPSTPVTNP
jgi:rhamnopyranosyl-N-acetylglucosaminyl-diphospho-decaprenol beta-1,3/1,4-galactofuranosyltransferase